MINIKRVSKYCKEDLSLIENYDKAINDQTQIWDCHHRLETDKNLSRQYLINNDLYYSRPASELIFLTRSEHTALHNEGKQHSEETRKKISESNKGKHHTEETRKQISEAMKRRWKNNRANRVNDF